LSELIGVSLSLSVLLSDLRKESFQMKHWKLLGLVLLSLALALWSGAAGAAGSHDEALEIYNGKVYVLNSRGDYDVLKPNQGYEPAVVLELNESDFSVARPPVTLENSAPLPRFSFKFNANDARRRQTLCRGHGRRTR
jgi:hypothetical protein